MARLQPLRPPHSRAGRENLESIRANLVCPLRRAKHPARRRQMNPNAPLRHRTSLRHVTCQGFKRETCVGAKSPAFLVTRVSSKCSAVAASSASMLASVLPFRFASAEINPHRSATARSIDRILPAKRAGKSTPSQLSSCERRFPETKPATPLRISPIVSTLRCRRDSSVASIHSSTLRSGLGLTTSEMQFVSSRNPFTIRSPAPGRASAQDRDLLPPAEIRERTELDSLAGATLRKAPRKLPPQPSPRFPAPAG